MMQLYPIAFRDATLYPGDVLNRTYETQVCSAARALETVGERWTLLIVRDALLGVRRFEDFQRSLGIARNVLTDRLGRLVEAGVLERRAYSERPPRDEYRLTDKGRDLWPVVHALVTWGDRYEAPDGPPRTFTHRDCGGSVNAHRLCDRCGAELDVRDIETAPGPGAVAA
jgi:DNA-binding HxlR family transcriptional regulator